MPADPIDPDQLDGQARFRADLLAYLDSLPVHELADLLGELPSRRQQPLQLGVFVVALNERLPDAYKLLPPAGQPGPGEGWRRSLREAAADRPGGQVCVPHVAELVLRRASQAVVWPSSFPAGETTAARVWQ
jgi:hypothetical protein